MTEELLKNLKHLSDVYETKTSVDGYDKMIITKCYRALYQGGRPDLNCAACIKHYLETFRSIFLNHQNKQAEQAKEVKPKKKKETKADVGE